MKKALVLTCLLVGAAVLGACRSASAGNSGLTGVVWQWTSMEETVPASQNVVPDPENYTITFNEGGTIDVKADCNMGSGKYQQDGSSLTITVQTMTMAYCGDASADQVYLGALAKVASYEIQGGELTLSFASDAGQMHFQNGGAAG
ncbi:MAG TPA: META domain-containing protein [Anaerolineales bacterium]|nr:META domain-containing protein [Anaerolineales bacterium]